MRNRRSDGLTDRHGSPDRASPPTPLAVPSEAWRHRVHSTVEQWRHIPSRGVRHVRDYPTSGFRTSNSERAGRPDPKSDQYHDATEELKRQDPLTYQQSGRRDGQKGLEVGV